MIDTSKPVRLRSINDRDGINSLPARIIATDMFNTFGLPIVALIKDSARREYVILASEYGSIEHLNNLGYSNQYVLENIPDVPELSAKEDSTLVALLKELLEGQTQTQKLLEQLGSKK